MLGHPDAVAGRDQIVPERVGRARRAEHGETGLPRALLSRLAGIACLALVAGLAAPALARPEPVDWTFKERHTRGPYEKGVWGGLARNRDELRRLWELYDQPGRMPVIRFEKNVAVVAGTTGSSSCPPRLHDVRLNRERGRVVVRMYEADGDHDICTADIVPRTFTVAVARAELRPLRAAALKLRKYVIEDPASGPETLSFVRKGSQLRGPDKTTWGDVGHDRDRLEVLWDRYRQRGKPPEIAFDKRVAVVAGTGGSSSCPTRLHDLRLHNDRKRIVVRVYTEAPDDGGGCTDDWVPKTFTVSVARSSLEPVRPRSIDVRVRRIEDPNG